MAEYRFPEVDPEFQVTVFPEPDSRGPVVLDDDASAPDTDPVKECFAKGREEQLAKSAGTVTSATIIPSFDEIIGLTPAMRDGALVKHVEVSPEEMALRKDLSKASSGAGRVRLEKTLLDGETWLFGYDHLGEEVFARPFVEDAA